MEKDKKDKKDKDKKDKKTIKVNESELDMFAKYGVKVIQKGKTEIKIVKN